MRGAASFASLGLFALLLLQTADARAQPQGQDDDGPECKGAFIERVYRETRPSVVRIQAGSAGSSTVAIASVTIGSILPNRM